MFIRHFISILKISKWNLMCAWKNIQLNYLSSSVKRDKGAYLFIYPNVLISIEKNALIELHGNLNLGIPSIKGNRQVSKFLMKSHSMFIVHSKCDFLDAFDIQIHSGGIFSVEDFHSNVGLEISCGRSITLHGHVMAGRHVRLKDYNGHVVSYEGYPVSAPITIENHVWLCSGSCVGPGVKIDTGVVVGDNANVTSNVPSSSFILGNPAKIIDSNISWSK